MEEVLMHRVLSGKGSCQIERCSGVEQDSDEASERLVIRVIPSQQEPLETPLAAVPSISNNSMLLDSVDGRNKKSNRQMTISPRKILFLFADSVVGRNKKSNRQMTINPRKILFLFATISSMGTMILIYFTLALNWRGGS